MCKITKSEQLKIRQTISLLSSMVSCGENHSPQSMGMISSSLEILNKCLPSESMGEIYGKIKAKADMPVGRLLYTFYNFDRDIDFGALNLNFHDDDEKNIKRMEAIKDKYGDFFMFFNNSEEGEQFWKNNPIQVTPKRPL